MHFHATSPSHEPGNVETTAPLRAPKKPEHFCVGSERTLLQLHALLRPKVLES